MHKSNVSVCVQSGNAQEKILSTIAMNEINSLRETIKISDSIQIAFISTFSADLEIHFTKQCSL